MINKTDVIVALEKATLTFEKTGVISTGDVQPILDLLGCELTIGRSTNAMWVCSFIMLRISELQLKGVIV